MKKLKFIVNTGDDLINMYWIGFNSNVIIGWCYGNKMFDINRDLVDKMHLESHFTYPKDGNYHISYKSINKDPDFEAFISVYWNKIRVKKIIDGKREIFEKKREESDGHLVPMYKQNPLNEIEYHAFPLVVFRAGKKDYYRYQKIKKEEVGNDDIVANLSELQEDQTLNISSFVRCSDRFVENDLMHNPSLKILSKNLALSNSRLLELRCVITNHKEL